MLHRNTRHPFFLLGVLTLCFLIEGISAQDVNPQAEQRSEPSAEDSPPQVASAVAALKPLFRQLVQAKSTRATVELSADTIVDGAVVSSQKSVYQIASIAPDQFTIYLKDETRGTRIYCDGQQATVALSPVAFAELEKPIPLQKAVYQLPLPMGPYPEAVLALTLAGIDPALTLTTGMKSVRIIDRNRFRGQTPSIHFEGIQDDDVKWELWITQDTPPKPLRLLVDLTDMLRANGGLEMSEGYRYVLRFDFVTWRLGIDNDSGLFRFRPVGEAKRYGSIDEYFKQTN
jgi:hypothetical protein